MPKHLTYYCGINSPWSFFSDARLMAILDDTEATVDVRPVDLGSVFGETGGLPLPKRSQQRRDYRMSELKRWRRVLGIPFVLEPKHFPTDERIPMAMVIATNREDPRKALELHRAFGHAQWVQDVDFSLEAVQRAVCAKVGLDPDAMLAEAKKDAYVAAQEENTADAIAAGVFGAPGFVIDGEVFWGQDRIDFLREALSDV